MRWDERKLRVFDVDANDLDSERVDANPMSSILKQALRLGGVQTDVDALNADAETQLQQTIDQYLAETFGQAFECARIDPNASPAASRILSSEPQRQRDYARRIVQRLVGKPGNQVAQLQALLTSILRGNDEWGESILSELVSGLASFHGRYLWPLPTASVLRMVQRYLGDHELSAPLRRSLEDLRRLYKVRATGSDERKLYQRINDLLESTVPSDAPLDFSTGEAWTTALAAQVNAEPPDRRVHWRKLLEHAGTAKTSTPRPTWLKQAAVLLDAVGSVEFCDAAALYLQRIGQPGDVEMFRAQFEHRTDASQIHEQYSDLLRGLIWCTAVVRSPELIPILGRAAELCFERLPRKQPRSLKVAIACIHALTLYRSCEALQELLRLQSRARQASVKTRLAAAVLEIRQFVPLTLHELDELSVPDLELADFGQYRCCIGKHTATITIETPGVTRLSWQSQDKPPQHVVPAAVKSFHSAELAKVRKRSQEILAELPPLKLRLERLLMSRACWNYAEFRRHYLDHPLVGPFARCLIWRFDNADRHVSAMWHDGQLRDRSNQPLTEISDKWRVSSWHPLTSDLAEVQAWQLFVEQHGICQPFKQAHREVYGRTADEAGESRRFAGHFVELFRLERITPIRGWQLHDTELLETVHTPYWDLPDWNLRAYWSTVPHAEMLRRDRVEPNSQGISFQTLNSGQFVMLKDVPSIVYSEVMRDVECFFLQYAATENFASGHRHGASKRMREYWMQFAFGPSTVQGEMRKLVVSRLLPASKLADCCEIQGEFLNVRGERNDYRIHLSSGGVQMGRGAKIIYPYGYPFTADHTGLPPGDFFPRLPFGGDVRLACILRQARRLSRESTITEQQLLDQIGP